MQWEKAVTLHIRELVFFTLDPAARPEFWEATLTNTSTEAIWLRFIELLIYFATKNVSLLVHHTCAKTIWLMFIELLRYFAAKLVSVLVHHTCAKTIWFFFFFY